MAQSVWTGGSHHTGLAALPHENIHQELNIHAQVQELAEKIVEFRRQKKGIDKSIEKIEKELHAIFDNARIDCMEVSMGMLVRRKKGENYEWVIEI